jgi:hypothetical protein
MELDSEIKNKLIKSHEDLLYKIKSMKNDGLISDDDKLYQEVLTITEEGLKLLKSDNDNNAEYRRRNKIRYIVKKVEE